MANGPWGLIPAFFNKVGDGIAENDSEYEQNAKLADMQSRKKGMVYQEAQQPDKEEAMTPFKVVGPIDRALSGGYNPMETLFAGAIKGEKSLYQPSTGPVAGGYSIQPTNVDSSQQTFHNSGMSDYLNYMKYRGGY